MPKTAPRLVRNNCAVCQHHWIVSASMVCSCIFKLSILCVVFLASSVAQAAFQKPSPVRKSAASTTKSALSVSSVSYLSSLGKQPSPAPTMGMQNTASDYLSSLSGAGTAITNPTTSTLSENPSYFHAHLSDFDISKLQSKGPRQNADVGEPHDATKALGSLSASATGCATSLDAGTWWCAVGGWPSPNRRSTTEIFFVRQGHGCLTDRDGTTHYFGPGDTVILPKGWSGRWDVLQDIHKVWFVIEHDDIAGVQDKDLIRVQVEHYHGLPPTVFYEAGPIRVSSLQSSPDKIISSHCSMEGFHILEGSLSIVDASTGNLIQACRTGDTVLHSPERNQLAVVAQHKDDVPLRTLTVQVQ